MHDSWAVRGLEMNSRRLWIALAGYIALLVVLSLHHEMWRDEVRALSVATSGSWGEMFAALHHEGHPSLWYMILRIINSIVGASVVLPVVAMVIATVTAW